MCSEENSDFQGCINNVCVLVVLSCLTLATPWTVARQAPLSMGFSRKEYWSGLPFPPPGDLPNPATESAYLVSPTLAGGFFIISFKWEACSCLMPS